MADLSNLHIAHIAVGAAAGAFTWTVTEYAAHRWVLHGPFGKGKLKQVPLGGLHRAHHRDPGATSLAARTAGHVAVAGSAAVASVGLGMISSVAFARSAAAAFAAGYSTYEINHWNAHHRPARTEWGRRLRARHERHHYGAPSSNLGVTISLWDQVFGTEAPLADPIDVAA